MANDTSLFYDASFSASTTELILPIEEARHLIQVLRYNVGDVLQLTNGKGLWATASILDAHVKACVLKINSTQDAPNKRSNRIHLAIAPTKNIDRMEWLVEKLAEIGGIDQLSFIQTQRSERKVIKLDRLEKIAIAAHKQALSYSLPIMTDLQPFKAFIKQCTGPILMAHCIDDLPKQSLKNTPNLDNLTILIGPEGDFTPSEIELATKYGAVGLDLGTIRMRTETAGLMACALTNFLNQG